MAVRVVAVDDEPGILCLIDSIIEEISYGELVGQAGNAVDGIKTVKAVNPDAVFLDIDLPDMSGIHLAGKLKEYNPDLYVVFITAHSDFSLEAYRLYAFDYIVKPIDEDRVKSTLRRIHQLKNGSGETNQKKPGRITVRDGDQTTIIDLDSVFYLEKLLRKTLIYTDEGIFEITESLDELEGKLGTGFFRSHKSYIVNLSKIEKLVSSKWVASYQVKFKNYPYEAILSKARATELLNRVKI